MTASIEYRDMIENGFPSNASFFDIYEDDTLIAHAQRPRVYSKTGWRVTLYRPNCTAFRVIESTHSPRGAITMHRAKMRRNQIPND